MPMADTATPGSEISDDSTTTSDNSSDDSTSSDYTTGIWSSESDPDTVIIQTFTLDPTEPLSSQLPLGPGPVMFNSTPYMTEPL
mmetsp:Transcript_42597/g.59175  ORF Transcript_42597/g.59175 Transcript_42597/m.59175 type:complete len:84 (-) Transcript_42597:45-296(-)